MYTTSSASAGGTAYSVHERILKRSALGKTQRQEDGSPLRMVHVFRVALQIPNTVMTYNRYTCWDHRGGLHVGLSLPANAPSHPGGT